MVTVALKKLVSVLLIGGFSFLSMVASADSVTAPNWSELERRLFENPEAVLDILNNKDIGSWSDRQKARYYDLLSGAHLIFSDFEQAEASLQQGLAVKESADAYTLVNLLVTQAYFRELYGELEAAESGYRSALRIAEQSGEYDAIIVALNAMVSFYSFTQENYELALEYVNRAIAIASSVNRPFLVGDLYNYFGSILSYTGDSAGALKQYQVAESIYTEENNNVSLSAMLYNRATLLEESGEYIAALRTYQAFMDRARLWGDPTADFFGNTGIANIYNLTERYELAAEALQKAREAIDYIADAAYLFDFWTTAAYVGADIEDFNLTDEALEQLESLSGRISDTEMSWTHASVINVQKYIAKAKGDFELAFEHSERLRRLQFDLLEQEQQETIAQLRIDSESAMYQAETDRLAGESRRLKEVISAKNQLQQVMSILLVIMAVSLIALGITLRRRMRQMRILQQYSAISESVKTSGQKVMDSVAGLLFDQSERRKSPLSVVVIECHSMADIREQFGERAVEAAHAWIMSVLDAELREEDKSGQISFERFMLLLPGADVKVARKYAQRLMTTLTEQAVPGWPQIELAISAGVSERSRHDRSPTVLTHRATTAVDMARDAGALQVKTLTI